MSFLLVALRLLRLKPPPLSPPLLFSAACLLTAQDMVEQQKALKKLLERSGARAPSTQSSGTQLHLPFILVQVGWGKRALGWPARLPWGGGAFGSFASSSSVSCTLNLAPTSMHACTQLSLPEARTHMPSAAAGKCLRGMCG